MNNPVAAKVAKSIRDQPDEWTVDLERRITLDHKASGVQVWVANGWAFCAIWAPEQLKLGLLGRTIVWIAASNWLRTNAPNTSKAETFWRNCDSISNLLSKKS
ncbi:hypothetical protein PQR71_07790 [Paraburkholderia fungorum]|uniref:hypothetical protein n=1 Tax=Paraburkholderia fungorum TaxID=134537 RepID=UPI0038B8BBF4